MSGVYEIRQPSELLITINILQSEIRLSEEDAKVILGYMQGHDFMLALDEGQLVRVDISEEHGSKVPYTMDEVIDLVCEWNYEQLEEAREAVENPKNFAEYCEYKFVYDALKEDEAALNGMFAQTIYGQDVRKTAKAMIEQAGGKLPEAMMVSEESAYPKELKVREEGRKR